MEKAFRPIPLELLARWVFGELESRETVLGIPKASFARPEPRFASLLQGRALAAPLGVAAGPLRPCGCHRALRQLPRRREGDGRRYRAHQGHHGLRRLPCDHRLEAGDQGRSPERAR